MSAPLVVRPTPIREAFRSVGSAVALAGSVVAALVTWGLLSTVQADALTGVLSAVPGVVTLVTTLLVAFGVVKRAEPQVTPLYDPARVVAVDGVEVLVPLVPDTESARRA